MCSFSVIINHSEASVSKSVLWEQYSLCIKRGNLARCLIEFLLKPRIHFSLNPASPGPSTSPPSPCGKYFRRTAKVPQWLWSVTLQTKPLLI